MWSAFMVNKPEVIGVVWDYMINQEELFIQFLLDPSCLPLVISSQRTNPDIPELGASLPTLLELTF